MSARHFLSLALSFGVLSCSGTAHQLTPGMLDQNVYCYGNVDEGLWCVDEVDLWSCDAIAARTNKCTTTPTGSDNWSCKEVDGRAVCTMAGGGDYSGPGWDCDYDEEMAQTTCTSATPVEDIGGGVLVPPGEAVGECEVEEFGVSCTTTDDEGGSDDEVCEQAEQGSCDEGDDDASRTPESGDFRTQTPGGWGTRAAGNNPGTYRDAHFDEAFPQALTVGCEGGYTATFSSSKAIEDFLPAGSTPGALDKDYRDPTSTSAGVLAGHVVALTLAVGFDAADPNFGASDLSIEHLVALSGSCKGLTVRQILASANNVLGGCDSWTSASEITGCVDAINNNFVDGTRAGGYLGNP